MLAPALTNALSSPASAVPSTNSVPAPAALGALAVPTPATLGAKNPNNYSGYYANIVGALHLTATMTVPTVKCTNSTTWGSDVGILAIMDSPDPVAGTDEHGGGIEVGCAGVTGTPLYSAVLCGEPTLPSGCTTLADTVLPGDSVAVDVAAGGGCRPTCGSVVVTVMDTTQDWTESSSGTSNSDFDTFVAAVGSTPLVDFGKVTLTDVTSNGAGFDGRRSNLIDDAGHTLARAGTFTKARTSFSVRWVRSS
ncbi:MAG TPA: hypothetical protein VN799_02135 [Acidimicrobiales bacterium]|nr:hypothetical protein [Acidimicrobiales bacterium]